MTIRRGVGHPANVPTPFVAVILSIPILMILCALGFGFYFVCCLGRSLFHDDFQVSLVDDAEEGKTTLEDGKEESNKSVATTVMHVNGKKETLSTLPRSDKTPVQFP